MDYPFDLSHITINLEKMFLLRLILASSSWSHLIWVKTTSPGYPQVFLYLYFHFLMYLHFNKYLYLHFLILLLEFSFPLVRPFVRSSVRPHFLHASYIVNVRCVSPLAWAPEGREGQVKRPEGPRARSEARRAPKLLVCIFPIPVNKLI